MEQKEIDERNKEIDNFVNSFLTEAVKKLIAVVKDIVHAFVKFWNTLDDEIKAKIIRIYYINERMKKQHMVDYSMVMRC